MKERAVRFGKSVVKLVKAAYEFNDRLKKGNPRLYWASLVVAPFGLPVAIVVVIGDGSRWAIKRFNKKPNKESGKP